MTKIGVRLRSVTVGTDSHAYALRLVRAPAQAHADHLGIGGRAVLALQDDPRLRFGGDRRAVARDLAPATLHVAGVAQVDRVLEHLAGLGRGRDLHAALERAE